MLKFINLIIYQILLPLIGLRKSFLKKIISKKQLLQNTNIFRTSAIGINNSTHVMRKLNVA